jgi:anti-anti-sigma factor
VPTGEVMGASKPARLYLPAMKLTLETRHVGSTSVVRCTGRIVAGDEVQVLRKRVTELIAESQNIVLQLAGISFLDSSGMGMLMQVRASTNSRGSEVLLAEVPRLVQDALSITGLLKLFRVYPSEAEAVAAGNKSVSEEIAAKHRDCILCVSETADVRTFLRTVLTAASYNPLTCESFYDARVLLKTSKPKLIILSPHLLTTVPDLVGQFRALAPSIPVLSLDQDFSAQEAGQAGRQLLDRVSQVLGPVPTS